MIGLYATIVDACDVVGSVANNPDPVWFPAGPARRYIMQMSGGPAFDGAPHDENVPPALSAPAVNEL